MKFRLIAAATLVAAATPCAALAQEMAMDVEATADAAVEVPAVSVPAAPPALTVQRVGAPTYVLPAI